MQRKKKTILIKLLIVMLFSNFVLVIMSCNCMDSVNQVMQKAYDGNEITIKETLTLRFMKPFERITAKEFRTVTVINTTGFILTNIDGLNKCYNLRTFKHVGRKRELDYTNIIDLKKLEELDLSGPGDEDTTAIVAIGFIRNLVRLQSLSLQFNRIEDLSPLTELRNVKYLNLHSNEIENIDSLSSLVKLEFLALSMNRIKDISSLSLMKNLHELFVSNNDIESLDPLVNLMKLTSLDLSSNQISDITPLVEKVYIYNNVKISLLSNPLSDKAIYEDIPALEARGVTVYYDKPDDYDPSKIKLPDETVEEKTESD